MRNSWFLYDLFSNVRIIFFTELSSSGSSWYKDTKAAMSVHEESPSHWHCDLCPGSYIPISLLWPLSGSGWTPLSVALYPLSASRLSSHQPQLSPQNFVSTLDRKPEPDPSESIEPSHHSQNTNTCWLLFLLNFNFHLLGSK